MPNAEALPEASAPAKYAAPLAARVGAGPVGSLTGVDALKAQLYGPTGTYPKDVKGGAGAFRPMEKGAPPAGGKDGGSEGPNLRTG